MRIKMGCALAFVAALVACVALTMAAHAEPWAVSAAGLLLDEVGGKSQAIDTIAHRGGPTALEILEALDEGELRIDKRGEIFRVEGLKVRSLGSASAQTPTLPLRTPMVDNELRRTLEVSLATLRLASPDVRIRRTAAESLAAQPNETLGSIARAALPKEQDTKVRNALAIALAWTDLEAADSSKRLEALRVIADAPSPSFRAAVERVLSQSRERGTEGRETEVRAAASKALAAIRWREVWTGFFSHLYYGLSLGSVLLLISLGLAITFGLMKVINMAHGELLMVGAYSTYVTQQCFNRFLPRMEDYYLIAAVPVAFILSAAVGLLIERLVLRYLYGRPLETLLATWGVSLMLIQVVRQVFGAQNVTVGNPRWLSGGAEIFSGFVLTYNRLAVIIFSLLVMAFVWVILARTRLGLQVRAVTQNREMAASMGIATRTVDRYTFAIGAGVAGLGGVALSQLGNVGPELGQGYIIDAFMVVVLGGVGNLVGTLSGAMSLGIANKWAEPVMGAVLGKIAILTLIVIFIQRRPQGLFALKGRAVET